MKAITYKAFGEAKQVLKSTDIELITPAENEVQVQLHASGVNPSDVKKRAGQRGEFSDEFIIPHSDGAGVITAVGKGVDDQRLGERVWIHSAQHNRHWGTACQMLNIDAKLANPLSEACSFAQGACFGIPIMTAHRCVTLAGPIAGQNVLVTGALGRVGFYAVQLAKKLGATVLATYGAETDKKKALALGADFVVSHRQDDFAQQLEDYLGGAKVNHVVDVEFGVNLERYMPILADYAAITAYASGLNPLPAIPFYALMFKNLSMHPVFVYAMPEAAIARAISDINQWTQAGGLQFHQIDEFTLDDCIAAHEHIEQGARGHTILHIE